MVYTYVSLQISPTLVSFAAVFRDVTQRSSGRVFSEPLRDIPKERCEGDYPYLPLP